MTERESVTPSVGNGPATSRVVRVFRYVEPIDAFVVTDEYRRLADRLGLTEWSPVVWIGRLFARDNDFGEHWFDNWDEREAVADHAKSLGLEPEDLLIVVPHRFEDGRDGPCNTPTFRKRFWTEVLTSLELSYDLLFDKARSMNMETQEVIPEEYIADLEERIAELRLAAG